MWEISPYLKLKTIQDSDPVKKYSLFLNNRVGFVLHRRREFHYIIITIDKWDQKWIENNYRNMAFNILVSGRMSARQTERHFTS